MVFVHKTLHLFIFQCIHTSMHHTQTPKYSKHSPSELFGSLLLKCPHCHRGKAFRKTLIMTIYLGYQEECAIKALHTTTHWKSSLIFDISTFHFLKWKRRILNTRVFIELYFFQMKSVPVILLQYLCNLIPMANGKCLISNFY